MGLVALALAALLLQATIDVDLRRASFGAVGLAALLSLWFTRRLPGRAGGDEPAAARGRTTGKQMVGTAVR